MWDGEHPAGVSMFTCPHPGMEAQGVGFALIYQIMTIPAPLFRALHATKQSQPFFPFLAELAVILPVFLHTEGLVGFGQPQAGGVLFWGPKMS